MTLNWNRLLLSIRQNKVNVHSFQRLLFELNKRKLNSVSKYFYFTNNFELNHNFWVNLGLKPWFRGNDTSLLLSSGVRSPSPSSSATTSSLWMGAPSASTPRPRATLSALRTTLWSAAPMPRLHNLTARSQCLLLFGIDFQFIGIHIWLKFENRVQKRWEFCDFYWPLNEVNFKWEPLL